VHLGEVAAEILVLSQVVLSFTLPFALIPLIVLTRRANVMGDLARISHEV
jgi:manganese transport protein